MVEKVKTRFPPSPTGFLHVGGLRTALYNFLFARKNHGKFLVRMEDTDRLRLVPTAAENILQTLDDFRLHPDEGQYWNNGISEKGELGPYQQSSRLAVYKKYADELVQKTSAYYCFCSTQRLEQLRKDQEAAHIAPKYDKHCLSLSKEEIQTKLESGESKVIRLNIPPNSHVILNDLVHGEIEISTNDLDDQVLLKSDGYPTYHLANVVDDHLMEVTHVIRGEEWIPSTPKHILLYQALGWELPKFAHLPLLLSKTRKKLSKREGDVAVKSFLDAGYLPEALLNFVALLGWNPKTEQEIFSLTELIDQFSLDKVNKAGAVFDLEKLDWINGLYIRKLSLQELMARIVPYLVKAGIDHGKYPREFIEKILYLEQERLKKLSEIGDRIKYFFQEPEYDPSLLIWKKSDKQVIMHNLNKLQELLEKTPVAKLIKSIFEPELKKYIEQNKLKTGEVLWPLRVALTGHEASPGPFDIIDAFMELPDGKQTVLKRVSKAAESLF